MQKIETFTLPETRFLSNFFPYINKFGEKYTTELAIYYNGFKFDCVETAYQAAKSEDMSRQEQFVFMTPYAAKAFWQGRENEIRSDWFDVRDDIMFFLCAQKFLNHYSLSRQLKSTGTAELIEGNTWGDTYWGVCDGVGQNQLGKLLQRIRRML